MDILEKEKIAEAVETLIEKMGFKIVEINYSRRQSNINIRAVVYGENGVSLSDCESLYKTVYPKIEMILEDRNDLYLEITSPGIDRLLKSFREYEIFKGKNAKIMLKGKNDWIRGTISGTGNDKVFIDSDGGSRFEISYQDIQKGKLDY